MKNWFKPMSATEELSPLDGVEILVPPCSKQEIRDKKLLNSVYYFHADKVRYSKGGRLEDCNEMRVK